MREAIRRVNSRSFCLQSPALTYLLQVYLAISGNGAAERAPLAQIPLYLTVMLQLSGKHLHAREVNVRMNDGGGAM